MKDPTQHRQVGTYFFLFLFLLSSIIPCLCLYLYPWMWPLFVLAFLVYVFEMDFIVINHIKEKGRKILENRWIGGIVALALVLGYFWLDAHLNGPYVDTLWGFD